MKEEKPHFYVVGIGASAGGLEPLQKFFDSIDTNQSAAYIIVQHLSPDFESLMDELLSRHTDMKVSTVRHNEIIEPNHV